MGLRRHQLPEPPDGPLYCADCLHRTEPVIGDYSFGHEFGTEYDYRWESICCNDRLIDHGRARDVRLARLRRVHEQLHR